MGRDLGCFGHISELRRIEVAPFTEEDLVTLEELEAAWPPIPPKEEEPVEPVQRRDFSAIDALVVETGAALDCLPQVALSDEQAQRVRLGNPVIIRGRDAPLDADEACVTTRGKLLAIGYIEHGQFKPKRVFSGS